MPRAQIKDEKMYQRLRDQGESKGKSARIANAAAGSSRSKVGRKGGEGGSYSDWSKQDLVQRAKEIGIKGRSTMTKAELINAAAPMTPRDAGGLRGQARPGPRPHRAGLGTSRGLTTGSAGSYRR
jgi:hypothetical protein